jgi:hypothetical protein
MFFGVPGIAEPIELPLPIIVVARAGHSGTRRQCSLYDVAAIAGRLAMRRPQPCAINL